MSQLINELATIEVSNDALQQLGVANIYQDFSKNYRRLDELKNFRTEYEKKNRVMRWWHNDKLRDAQLDSAEVQAEFSKTIGQLMMIGIMQSKKLAEQQTQLNNQQGGLKKQADGIAEHAGALQQQHETLARQSEKLETLVKEYFALKGLTEDGAQRLIEIAAEIKATKEGMLVQFAVRAEGLEALHSETLSKMASISAEVSGRIADSEKEIRSEFQALGHTNRQALLSVATALRDEHESAQVAVNKAISALEDQVRAASAAQFESEQAQKIKVGMIESAMDAHSSRLKTIDEELAYLKTELALYVRQQNVDQQRAAEHHGALSNQVKNLSLGVVAVGILAAIAAGANLLKWL